MEEVFGVGSIVYLVATAVTSIMFVFSGTLNSSVINACKEHGYWQTGQVRVICEVEEPKK